MNLSKEKEYIYTTAENRMLAGTEEYIDLDEMETCKDGCCTCSSNFPCKRMSHSLN